MSNLFTGGNRPTTYVGDKDQGEKKVVALIQALIQEIGVEELDPVISVDVNNQAQHEKICELQTKLNLQINDLSDNQFLDVYSYINDP